MNESKRIFEKFSTTIETTIRRERHPAIPNLSLDIPAKDSFFSSNNSTRKRRARVRFGRHLVEDCFYFAVYERAMKINDSRHCPGRDRSSVLLLQVWRRKEENNGGEREG